ncbi:HDOD domain-containing protein [Dechloromonas sp. XY25]|uniref:HDOD domain-containing protein n=1 Tax=Dechloromonas hankyongensis TaxID=2908002 RepID=A0ABS9K4V9_9RHOO|nr:HDOD domain-containing protein [Dechloromonas hankyongensis]MCG2578206.1 HDOD domain-containing protein [Dechloromonas hankyongensis]
MFSRLKKLLGKSTETTVPPAAGSPAEPAFTDAAFVRREAIFDRDNRLSAHLFRMQQATAVADRAVAVQRDLDRQLFDTLNASTEAWNRTPAFLPISSASLDLTALETLAGDNVVLLLQLAPDAEADQVCEAIEQLRERGFRFGLFRQPRHPAYATVIQKIDYAAIDVAGSDAGSIRDFSAAVRAGIRPTPLQLLACNVETIDDQQLCLQWHFNHCHGKFAEQPAAARSEPSGDPHKTQLLNLLRLVQSEAETGEIAAAMKLDPLLSFRILRYLNSPILALTRQIDSLEQALMILGRQRLTRWLAVLLFSVREPQLSDWLLVENALTRGRLMEILAEQRMPGQPHDPLFLTGIFSCLHRLLHRPLADILPTLPIADEIRQALLERSGPYAALLAVAEAAEAVDQSGLAAAAQTAGVTADAVNGALLAATAWASEVTEYWE